MTGSVDGTDLRAIAVDFDGVINSYTSGWQGSPTNLPDKPVEGAIAWLCEAVKHYTVFIHSCRCETPQGRLAMRFWLEEHGMPVSEVRKLQFTHGKPNAGIYLDDRGWRFEGIFPTMEEISSFRPWNRR